MHHFWNRISMIGVEDCRREEILPGKATEALMSFAPSIDSARDSHAVNALVRHRSDALLLEEVDRQLARRPSAGVQAVEFAGFRVPIEKEEIAANAVHHWLGHAEDGIGRNGGIDCGAS